MDDRVIPGHECSAWDNLVILIEVQHLKVFKKNVCKEQCIPCANAQDCKIQKGANED